MGVCQSVTQLDRDPNLPTDSKYYSALCGTRSNTMLLGYPEVSTPNGTLIRSAVFEQPIQVTDRWSDRHPRYAIIGCTSPHHIYSMKPKIQKKNCVTDGQTDRQTDLQTAACCNTGVSPVDMARYPVNCNTTDSRRAA